MARYFPQHSVAQRLTDAQLYFMKGKATMALGELNEVFDTLPPSHPWFALVTSMLATYYKDYPEKRDEYIYYLTLSAIADLRSANGEAASLAQLGSEMFKDGDIDRAFKYLTASEELLSKSGSRVLVSQMTPPLSDLAEAMRRSQMQTNRQFIFIMALLLLALTIFVIAQVHSRERIRHKDAANMRLNESVSSRDVYISRLLDLCAVYVEGLEDYNRLVSRKLKAGQAQDLYKLAESGSVIREQSEKFYEVFDQAILNIYPNFVADVNAILAPDKQIPEPPAGKLIPELRIVAFMRLGVTDSNRISKFLSLSLNTVYTYRNRMKSRAIDRENFESEIMKIGNNT
jgi:tetratricopeptide (TPR) repeat protein